MDKCHDGRIRMLQGVFKMIPNMGNTKVLEPGCGDGRLAKDLLQFRFEHIDMFDKCQISINNILAWKDTVKAIDRCECSSMAAFRKEELYDVILMSWVCGYLRKQELKDQLVAWKKWLRKSKVAKDRQAETASYIIIMDNISDNEMEYTSKGQRVRTQATLEDIFKKAGYKIVNKTARHELADGWEPTMAWVLAPQED